MCLPGVEGVDGLLEKERRGETRFADPRMYREKPPQHAIKRQGRTEKFLGMRSRRNPNSKRLRAS